MLKVMFRTWAIIGLNSLKFDVGVPGFSRIKKWNETGNLDRRLWSQERQTGIRARGMKKRCFFLRHFGEVLLMGLTGRGIKRMGKIKDVSRGSTSGWRMKWSSKQVNIDGRVSWVWFFHGLTLLFTLLAQFCGLLHVQRVRLFKTVFMVLRVPTFGRGRMKSFLGKIIFRYHVPLFKLKIKNKIWFTLCLLSRIGRYVYMWTSRKSCILWKNKSKLYL